MKQERLAIAQEEVNHLQRVNDNLYQHEQWKASKTSCMCFKTFNIWPFEKVDSDLNWGESQTKFWKGISTKNKLHIYLKFRYIHSKVQRMPLISKLINNEL